MPNYGYNATYQQSRPVMPQMNTISEYGFENDPQAAMSFWLGGRTPSTSQNQYLQRIMDQIFARYRGAAMANPTNPNMTFANFLRNLDPHREYLRASPTARNEEARRYAQPVRVV